MDVLSSQMQNSHRMFLQVLMSKGVMNKDEVEAAFIQCRKRFSEHCDEDMNHFPDFVRVINQAISPFNLEIKQGFQEHDGSTVHCLVNTVETPITRLSSTYTQNELELFKKVVENIVESENGKIGSRNALNLTEKLEKRMGKEEAQNFFHCLEKERWIIKGEDGKIALSIRAILELDQYLQEVFPDHIKKCNICSKIVLQGKSCTSCGIKIHLRCYNNLFDKQPERRCPSCKIVWNNPSP